MTADPIGGVWQYALELCSALGARGEEILLATLGATLSDEQRRAVAALEGVELEESAFRLEWMHEPWDDAARAGEWLSALAARFRPQLVHLNHLLHAELEWGSPVVSVGHSCVCSWWDAVHGGEPPPEWDRYRAQVARSLQAADCVVAPTRALLGELHRWHGPLRRSAAIANGRWGAPHNGPDRVRTRFPLVFAAGRVWDEAKNLGALAQIAPGLAWPVYVAGPTAPPGGRPRALPGLRLLGLLGEVEIRRWFARAGIFVAPALYEPFGLGVLEAALGGCPLVLGDIPSLREIWGPAALYVPPRDTGALRAMLERLIADPALRARCGAAARERARPYTGERCALAYRRLYARLRAARATPRSRTTKAAGAREVNA